jgi:hypothetical protein
MHKYCQPRSVKLYTNITRQHCLLKHAWVGCLSYEGYRWFEKQLTWFTCDWEIITDKTVLNLQQVFPNALLRSSRWSINVFWVSESFIAKNTGKHLWKKYGQTRETIWSEEILDSRGWLFLNWNLKREFNSNSVDYFIYHTHRDRWLSPCWRVRRARRRLLAAERRPSRRWLRVARTRLFQLQCAFELSTHSQWCEPTIS